MTRKHQQSLDVLIVGENPTVNIQIPVSLATLQAPRLPNHLILDRTNALRELAEFAHNGRSVAVLGAPAMGKTVLASMFCWRNAREFPDGIIWTRLGRSATAGTTFLEMARVAGCLGVSNSLVKKAKTLLDMKALLSSAIGTRRLLFVVDDVWDHEIVSYFQFGGPGCPIIITTRNADIAERFAGACVVRVSQLDTGDTHRLLRDQLKDVPASRTNIKQLAHVTGGCPLSVVIACANFRRAYRADLNLGREFVRTYLDDAAVRVNIGLKVPSPARHDTLDAPISLQVAIAQSWFGLSAPEKALLLATVLFPPDPSSFSKAALLAVTEGNEADLFRLQDSSLVQREQDGRLKVHQTVADFLTQQTSPPYRDFEQCLNYWYSFCEQVAERTPEGLAVIESEASNLDHFLQHAVGGLNSSKFTRCVSALATLFEIRGSYKEGKTLLRRSVAWLASNADKTSPAQMYGRLGSIAEKAGNYILAERLYRLGLRMKRTPQADKAYVLQNYGVLASKIGRPKQCLNLLNRALALARAVGDPARIAAVQKNIGAQTVRTGDFALCKKALSEALEIARHLRDRGRLSGVLTNFGYLHLCRGELDVARTLLKQALKIENDLKHNDKIGLVSTYLGLIDLKRGEVESAKTQFKRILEQSKNGHLQRRSLGGSYLALCYLEEGNQAMASKTVEEALRMSEQLGNRENIGTAWIVRGKLAVEMGDFALATQAFRQAGKVAQRGGYHRLIAIIKCEVANLFLAKGHFSRARAAFSAANRLARRMNLRETGGFCHFGMAQVALAIHRKQLARKQGKIALAIFQAMRHAHTRVIAVWLSKNT